MDDIRRLGTVLVALLLGCAGCRAPEAEVTKPGLAVAQEAPAVVHDARTLFVGPLVRNVAFDAATPATYCVDGVHYRGAPARVGRVNILGAAIPDGLDGGDFVIVRGELHASGLFAQLTAEPGECPQDPSPPMQWRSDWSADEGGYQTTRAALEAAPWLEAEEVRAAGTVLELSFPPGLERHARKRDTTELTGAVVTVTLHNPFDDLAWRDLELRAHYESTSHGKPMPLYETHTVELEPGKRVTLELPAVTEQTGAGGLSWRGALHDVHLRGGSPRALGTAAFAD